MHRIKLCLFFSENKKRTQKPLNRTVNYFLALTFDCGETDSGKAEITMPMDSGRRRRRDDYDDPYDDEEQTSMPITKSTGEFRLFSRKGFLCLERWFRSDKAG